MMNWEQCNELKSLNNEIDQNIHFLCTSSVKACALLNHFKLSQSNWNAEYNIYLRETGINKQL